MADQQRLDTVSAYGLNSICRTPHIDSLARRGIRFDNAFTLTAICSPSRASLFTGLYPHKHGVTANSGTIKEGVMGISQYLQKNGYKCGYAGKWHIDEKHGPNYFGFSGKEFYGYAFPGSDLLPGLRFKAAPDNETNHYEMYLKERGFELPTVSHRFVGKNPTNQDQEMFALHEGPVESCIEYFVAEEAIRVIGELANEEEPFFMWANFWGPHSPSLVPEPYFSMYNPEDIPEHPSYCETFDKKPYGHKLTEKYWGLGDYGWNGFQEISARYFGHCTLIDDMVGRIVDCLDRLNLLDNTIIIYTADHGDCMGAHKLIEKGSFMYDEIYRIPMIVAHPECQNAGRTYQDFVYLHDIMPSMLDIANVNLPNNLDGESILPCMLGQDYHNDREEVYCVFNSHFFPVNQRMIRTKTHQFTFNPGDIGELYDLVNDPYQLNNVYENPEYEEIRLDLIARMDSYMYKLKDPVHRWFRKVIGIY